MRPYHQQDGITLYHGDTREILPILREQGHIFDACITDPPYNETALEWDVWPDDWPDLVSTLTSSLWCFGSFKMFWNRRDQFNAWELSQDIVWEKHNGSGARNDRFRRIHELAIHLYRGNWKAIYHQTPVTMDALKITANRRKGPIHYTNLGSHKFASQEGGARLMHSIIYARSCHGHAVNETQKPEAIIAPPLEYAVPPGGSVIDIFAGSGTTLVEARRQGKQAIGIEKRRCQCDHIVRRLSQSELFTI